MTQEEILRRIIEISKKYKAEEVILFGSRAKGTAHEKSDFDIAVSGVKDVEELREQIEEIPMEMLKIRNELTHDYDGTILERYCKKIVETYIDVLYEFKGNVESLNL